MTQSLQVSVEFERWSQNPMLLPMVVKWIFIKVGTVYENLRKLKQNESSVEKDICWKLPQPTHSGASSVIHIRDRAQKLDKSLLQGLSVGDAFTETFC